MDGTGTILKIDFFTYIFFYTDHKRDLDLYLFNTLSLNPHKKIADPKHCLGLISNCLKQKDFGAFPISNLFLKIKAKKPQKILPKLTYDAGESWIV
jgi:hypothetical protein